MVRELAQRASWAGRAGHPQACSISGRLGKSLACAGEPTGKEHAEILNGAVFARVLPIPWRALNPAAKAFAIKGSI